MINHERQIASLISICVGIALLIVLPKILSSPVPEDTNTEPFQPDGAYIDTSSLNMPDQVCEDVMLRNPGGMNHTIAMICIHEEMELIINTDHLPRDQYDRLIQPVVDSLRTVAVEKGIRKTEIPTWGN